MLQISELYIYPIKSLSGIKLDTAVVTDRGFKYDRRWMLIDNNNRFISQREVALMALLKVDIKTVLQVINPTNNTSIDIALTPLKQQFIQVTVWDDTCIAQLVSDEADTWFTNALGMPCRLVYMPDDSHRFTEPEYSPKDSLTSFSDAYPFLIIGQASLNDLNSRLVYPLNINRFRPNIVFVGGTPYLEDAMDTFTISNITFNGVKLCARCNIITINQSDATTAKEPTKTLASYRFKKNKIYFGQNLVHTGAGSISVGDELIVLNTHNTERFTIPEKMK